MPQDFTFEDYLLVLLNFQPYGIFSLSHFMGIPKEELVEKLGHDFKINMKYFTNNSIKCDKCNLFKIGTC